MRRILDAGDTLIITSRLDREEAIERDFNGVVRIAGSHIAWAEVDYQPNTHTAVMRLKLTEGTEVAIE